MGAGSADTSIRSGLMCRFDVILISCGDDCFGVRRVLAL